MRNVPRFVSDQHSDASAKVIDLAAHRALKENPKKPKADPSSAWYHAAAVAEEREAHHAV